jgi:hypothetical protein
VKISMSPKKYISLCLGLRNPRTYLIMAQYRRVLLVVIQQEVLSLEVVHTHQQTVINDIVEREEVNILLDLIENSTI